MKSPFRSTWGMSPEEWDAARARMRELLVQVASHRGTITYGEISRAVFAGRYSARSSALAQMLEEVCTIEDAAHGLSLGSVVVRADTGIPGAGYYRFACDKLGRPVDPNDIGSCRKFWEDEVGRVWDWYSQHA